MHPYEPHAQDTWSTMMRSATLVVIEFGGSWPRWLKPTRYGDMAVVAQHYEGHPCSLISQVASRLTRLESMGWHLDAMVFVSNGRTDPDAMAARSVLGRGLLARLDGARGGRLVLTAAAPDGSRACRQLVALASAMQDEACAAVTLAVRTGTGTTIYGPALDNYDLARAC